jgi:hypothetical protein
MSQGLTLPNATDFCTEVEALAPGSSVLGGSDVIATELEQVVDLVVGREEALRLAGSRARGLQPLARTRVKAVKYVSSDLIRQS